MPNHPASPKSIVKKLRLHKSLIRRQTRSKFFRPFVGYGVLVPLGLAGSSSWWRTTDTSCQGLMALPLMVRLRDREQDDEESDAVEDVEVVRPLEEGE